MLGARCAAAGGVCVRSRLLTGTTNVLLPLFLLFRLRLPAVLLVRVLGNGKLEQAQREQQQQLRAASSSQLELRQAA